MGYEIERKFLVRGDDWRAAVHRSTPIVQGYFCRTPLLRARIRIFGERGFVTLKSEPGSLVRREFEYEIPKAEAEEIIECFSIEPLIIKTRHELTHAGRRWVVDTFGGANAGLVMAEVELDHPAQVVAVPAWAGEEVTLDKRYGNSNLARHPYLAWARSRG